MIRSFRGKWAESIFNRQVPKGFPADIAMVARRKLEAVNAAHVLGDLRSPPGNRLEELKRDRRGQHSIRINDQFRICFRWSDDGVDDVEIVDYHEG
ncbi:type II toxin-antitoxin system RelE/ParE family toxin [Labrys monachus]|uniref:Proteic killer suppression protein n=1 Tax=Labrys monachus TaxID=217067 RepID=A0ABU0FJQ0_9HYPH|nr:type II toxin-antitoxin system RelE/ParE family toxin [Labrys monachus]MDQ0394837.1 proteic killer suppression protein [Labrys monachus]